MPVNCPFEINPFDLSQPANTVNISNLNYTNQDFWSMKNRVMDFIAERFSQDFNDFVESSIAVMLIENFCFVADTLSFKIDQLANELFIDTVTEIENAFRLSKLIGFEPLPPIAARTMWSATINNPLTTNLVIPAPQIVDVAASGAAFTIELFPADSNNNPIFDEDIILPAGNTANTAIVGLEGRTVEDIFTANGETSQTYQLTIGPVIWDSIRVYVDGVQWSQVKYFTDSQPRREYRVEFNSDYDGFIIFGNNRAGFIPATNSTIRAVYRTGGGTVGNIITGFITTQRTLPIDGFAFTIPVLLRNYDRGRFGYDGDTIEDIRVKLPAWVKSQDRGVAGLDYKTLADQFATPYNGQIGKSVVALRNFGCAGNVLDLYVLARENEDGLVKASNELKVLLDEEFTVKKMWTDELCIRDGIIVSVDISVDITLDRSFRKFEDEIKERINRRINKFFSLNNWEFGQTLKEADLVKAISDIKEIRTVDITFTSDDPDNSGSVVTTRFSEIIRPDTTALHFIYE